MFTVELYAKVRHAVMIEGLSRREAAKRFGIHRNTITKMLSFSVPPGYRRRERPVPLFKIPCSSKSNSLFRCAGNLALTLRICFEIRTRFLL